KPEVEESGSGEEEEGRSIEESYTALASALLVPESESIMVSLYMRLASVRLEPSRSVYSLGSLHDVSVTCTVSGKEYRLKAGLGDADVVARKAGRMFDIIKRDAGSSDVGDLLALSLDPREAVLTAAKLVVLYDRALFSELIAIGSNEKASTAAPAAKSSSWWESVRQWDRLIAMQQQLGGG
ncbi:hypothetical protein FOZ63_017464, partial [Perkinsus olseni]